MKRYSCWALAGVIGTSIAALLPPSSWRIILMVFFTGMGPAILLPGRRSLVGLILTSLGIALPVWGLISLTCWSMKVPGLLPFGGAILNAICLAMQLITRRPSMLRPITRMDYTALILVALMAVPTLMIQQVNGPHNSPSGPVFLSRLYVAHDSFYFTALAQAAKDQQGYPTANPFMAGAPNAYPSLLHCGAGGLASLSDDIALLALWPVYPWLLLPGMGLTFLGLCRWLPRRNSGAVILLGFGFIAFLFIRPDHFIYLQTQGVALPLLGLALLAMPASAARGQNSRWIWFGMILILTILSHTVTAIAGMALLAGLIVRLALRRRVKMPIAGGALRIAILLTTAGLLLWTTSRISKDDGMDNIPEMLLWMTMLNHIFPYFPALLLTVWLSKRNGVWHPLAMAALMLCACTVIYWLLGLWGHTEDGIFFAVFNAARFSLFGFMFSLVFLPVKGRPIIFATAVLPLITAFYPPKAIQSLPDLVFEAPKVFRIRDWRMLRRALPAQPGQVSTMITNVPGYSISTVSGYGQYDPINRLFALGTQPAIEFEKRKSNKIAFFDAMTPQQRVQFMQSRHLNAVIAISPVEAMAAVENLMPRDAVDLTTGPEYSVFRMKPAAARN